MANSFNYSYFTVFANDLSCYSQSTGAQWKSMANKYSYSVNTTYAHVFIGTHCSNPTNVGTLLTVVWCCPPAGPGVECPREYGY